MLTPIEFEALDGGGHVIDAALVANSGGDGHGFILIGNPLSEPCRYEGCLVCGTQMPSQVALWISVVPLSPDTIAVVIVVFVVPDEVDGCDGTIGA